MRKGSERSRVARVIAAALARNRPRELLVRPPPSLPRGARRAPISPGRPTGRSASRADGGRRKRIFGLVPRGPHGDVAGFFFFLLEDDDDPLGFPFRPRRTGDEEAASTHPGDESQGGASMSVGECAGSAVRCATCTGPAGSSVPCGVGITVRLVRYDAAWRVGPAPARPVLCLRAWDDAGSSAPDLPSQAMLTASPVHSNFSQQPSKTTQNTTRSEPVSTATFQIYGQPIQNTNIPGKIGHARAFSATKKNIYHVKSK